MHIVVVDDEPRVVDMVAACLDQTHHVCQTFTDPRDALGALTRQVDLVISDITMPQIDGFRLALRVAAVLGMSPPRTLLMSGDDHSAQLAWASPAMVIGVLPKPFSAADLLPLLNLLEKARARCPGVLVPLCPCAGKGATVGLMGRRRCDTVDYAACRFYNTACGKSLQEWIGNRNAEST